MDEKKENSCDSRTEVYSRVVGYFRPVQNWNTGKKEEFTERKTYIIDSNLGPGSCGC
jgi:ribonucleoside-triphosphate reductase